jgi:hypothetical protein
MRQDSPASAEDFIEDNKGQATIETVATYPEVSDSYDAG